MAWKESISGIYEIRHRESGKVYVGSACHIRRRFCEHKSELLRGIHHSKHLQRVWNRYGEESLDFKIIETVESESDLLIREQYWINKMKACDKRFGFNMAPIAGRNTGVKHSEETKAKLRNFRLGFKLSDETKLKISESLKGRPSPMKGRTTPHEVRMKLSAANKGRPLTAEHKAKTVSANKARVSSPEHLAKMHAGQRKWWKNLSHDEKKTIADKSRYKRSPETCARIRASKVGMKLSKKHKENIGIGVMRHHKNKLIMEL